MPIRMTDDPVDPNQQDDDGGGGRRPNFPGGGGGGGIGSLLPLLLGLFKGKGIILLLVLAAGAYFLMNKSGGCNASKVQDIVRNFSPSGYDFNKDTFNKASIYEELDPNNPGN